jgi:hypothetical protein
MRRNSISFFWPSKLLPARKARSNQREIQPLQRERFSTTFRSWPH